MNNVVLFDIDGTFIDSYESILSAKFCTIILVSLCV